MRTEKTHKNKQVKINKRKPRSISLLLG